MKLNEIKKVTSHLQPYMFQTKEEIETWIKNNSFKAFMNKELLIEPAEEHIELGRFGVSDKDSNSVTIDVNGKKLLPVQFKLGMNFSLGRVLVDSLVGCPDVVLGSFSAQKARLKNLDGMPKLVNGKSLNLRLFHGKLANLEGFSKVGNHCDVTIDGFASIIESCAGLPSNIERLTIGCDFMNIKELVQTCPNLTSLWLPSVPDFSKNPTYSSLFRLKGLKDLMIGPERDKEGEDDNTRATDIYLKHLKSPDRDWMDCQEELIQAKLKQFAR